MSNFGIKTYQLILRIVVELLDLFPPKKMEKDEFLMRKGGLLRQYDPPVDGSIWVHGASLGEVITLRPFLKQLCNIYGRDKIVCTTTTKDGMNQLLKDELCGLATLLPVELPSILIPFINKIKPRVLLISETEIWPLMLHTLAEKKIPYGIINGRINESSLRMMRLAWSVFKSGIENMSFVFPQEKHYMRRFGILRIPKEKQKVLGCFKYDMVDAPPDISGLRERFMIPENKSVLCFGSTHTGEEKIILDALTPIFKELDAVVVIAPRHTKRASEVETLIKSRGLECNKASEKTKEFKSVILVDTMGELRKFYAASSLAFVGGSLVNHGGHNLMEPAAFAKPVVSGPYTFNFRYEMMAMKRNDAVIPVTNAEDLQAVLLDQSKNPECYKKIGKNGLNLLNSMGGATQRTIDALKELKFLP